MPDTLTVRENRLFADYDVPILAGPEYPNDTVTGPAGRTPRPQRAAAVPTGAMVALVPTTEDAARLAVDGGEPADELHLTLWYLGEAAAFDNEARTGIANAIRSMVDRRDLQPVQARVFGANIWNPDSDNPALVYAVGDMPEDQRTAEQDTLPAFRGQMSEAWRDGGLTIDLPPQHSPWQSHITGIYGNDTAVLADMLTRTGPVVFDRVRVAFAGETVDIPLSAPAAPLSLPGEPAMALADDDLSDVTDELLPIRAFTDPYDPLDDEGDDVGARTEARKERTQMRVDSKRKWFRIENRSSGTDIYLYGEVGYFGVTAADFTEELRQVKASTINLHINSPGGQVYEGVAIYNALKAHPATINVTVDGLAASAASFIACAGERVTIMRHAQMMIHDAWSDAYGNADKLRKQADTLERTSATIADIYSRKAGGDADTWRELMKAETWFNAEEAVQFGLADEIGGDVLAPAAPTKATWDLSVFAFAGRDRAPAPVLVPVALADDPTGPAPGDTPAPAAVMDKASPVHHTGTVEGDWDKSTHQGRLPSPMTVAAAQAMYGWYDTGRVEDGKVVKDACKLPHHEVSDDGTPGPANLNGVRNALARLPQSDIPEAEHDAIRRHLQAHLDDARSAEDSASNGLAQTNQASEPSTDTTPAPAAEQSSAWAAPAWATTTPADPWHSLVAGLTNPNPSTADGNTATAQEATE